MDDLHKLKALIAENNELPENISVTSLSFIGMEIDESAPVSPVSFDVLADAVKEVTGGIRMKFSAETYKGHQAVPFMNFNSLSRIVEMYRTAPPALPDDVAAALDYVDDFIARCNGNDRGACKSVNILRAAMLAATHTGLTNE